MAPELCPNCKAPRYTSAAYCPACGLALAPPMAPAAADKKPSPLGVLLVLAAIVVGVVVATGSLTRSGGVTRTTNTPGPGEVWFGDSFDTSSFALSNRHDWAYVKGQLAYVAHFSRSVSDQFSMELAIEGQAIPANTINVNGGPYDVYGGTLPRDYLFQPGSYTLTFRDFGGNTLAAGSFTVRGG